MTDDPRLPALDDELRAILAAESASGLAPTAAKARALLRLDAAIGGLGPGDGGSGPDDGGSGPDGGSGSSLGAGALAKLAAVFVAGAVTGGVVVSITPTDRAPVVTAPSATAIPGAPPSAEVAVGVAAARRPVAPEATATAPPSPPTFVHPTRDPAPAASDLAEERAILDTARVALMRREANAAEVALKMHETRYPRGSLAEEREAIWVQTLAAGGRAPEAIARADRFRRRYPDSVYIPSVNAATGSASDAATPSASASAAPGASARGERR